MQRSPASKAVFEITLQGTYQGDMCCLSWFQAFFSCIFQFRCLPWTPNCLMDHPHLTYSNPDSPSSFWNRLLPQPPRCRCSGWKPWHYPCCLCFSHHQTLPEFDPLSRIPSSHLGCGRSLRTGLPATTCVPHSLGSSQQPERVSYTDVNSCHCPVHNFQWLSSRSE